MRITYLKTDNPELVQVSLGTLSRAEKVVNVAMEINDEYQYGDQEPSFRERDDLNDAVKELLRYVGALPDAKDKEVKA